MTGNPAEHSSRETLRRCIAVLAAAPLLISAPAYTHHSSSGFDLDRLVAFQGTVTKFEWTNPHVYLTIRDENDIEWMIETDAAPVMSRSGWTRDSFAPGDAVTVRANPDRRPDTPHGLLLSIEQPDGRSLASLNRTHLSAGLESVASASDLQGVWRGEATAMRVFIDAMLVHPLTDKGKAAKAQYDQMSNPTVDCVTWPAPFIVASTLYLHEMQIGENNIVYRNEFYGTERIIHMDGREHPGDGGRTNQGHSVGWWEDETLVVDTVLFSDHRSPHAATVGVPSGSKKHVIERYQLSEDGAQIMIDVFLEDPEYLAESVTAQLIWNYSPHLEMLQLDCDSEVATRFTR